DQDIFVRSEPRWKLVRCTSTGKPVRGREILAVLLHLIGAEQLRSQWRLFVFARSWQTAFAQTRRQREQVLEDRRAACLQFKRLLRYREISTNQIATRAWMNCLVDRKVRG